MLRLLLIYSYTDVDHPNGGLYFDYYDELRDKRWRIPYLSDNITSSSYDTGAIKQLPW